MGLKGFLLRQQIYIFIIAAEINLTLLLNLSLELFDDLFLLIYALWERRVVVADLTRLLLDNHSLLFQSIELHILPFELILYRFFLHLQLSDLVIQLIQFNLLAFDLLIIIGQFFLALLLFPLYFSQLMLCIKEVIFALTECLLCDPALSLLVSFLVNQIFQLTLLVVQLLLHLAVSPAYPIDFLLKHLALVCFVLYVAFHLIYFRLSLADLVFDLLCFFAKIFHSSLLKFNFTLCFFNFVLKTFKKHTLRFTPILSIVPRIHLHFLILSVLQLKL